MKVSFVIIVLNGMPFIKAALRSIYGFAYEIIIVEGAVEKCKFAANSDGSSKDGTVEFVKAFPDPQAKIKLVQGQWPEKCEMQNKALELCSGDYIWIIDSDEIYKEEDIDVIIEILEEDSAITQVNIPILHFWRGFDYIIHSEILNNIETPRIFKLDKPCLFITHRPPALFCKQQGKTAAEMNVLQASVLRKNGIYLYHYSYVLNEQVKQKIELYKRYGWGESWGLDLDDWYSNCFLKWTPENKNEIEKKYGIWTCDKNSGTERFLGTHPKSIVKMILN